MINDKGYRSAVGIILLNDKNKVFWARRRGQPTAWQFPQGGLLSIKEHPVEAMYRELYEETGLKKDDVEILAESKDWLKYRLPKRYIRHYSQPLCIGQRQKWFLLRLIGDEQSVRFDCTDKPEFDRYRWAPYWYPIRYIIEFKKKVYSRALKEFSWCQE